MEVQKFVQYSSRAPNSASMVYNPPLLIAQVTDIHLFAETDRTLLGLPTTDSFEFLIEQLYRLNPQPDLLLLTGDLSQDGTSDSYDRLQSLLSPLGIPVYWLPGNHDLPDVMARSLTHPLFLPDKSFQPNGWQVVLLNSAVPGCVHGQLCADELAWLDQELQQNSECPAIVALHHPPLLTHSDWLDTSVLQNPDALFAVLDRHPQVKIVLFGHIHQEFQYQRKQVTYLGTPSTCIQFEPKSSKFALDHQKPGFRLLTLESSGRWHTQVKRIAYSHQLDMVAAGY
ncbi:3',5'-cyclic-AMP phosphodiesterase [Phormidesmis sp. 146-12]